MTDSREQRFQSATAQRFDQLEGRFDRVIDDLGPLKGAHAGNAAGKEAALIARDLGLGYRKSLTIIELLNLTDAADTTDVAVNELRSFHRADLIVEVTDSDGEVCYVAAEASYTVNGRDTERAIRNAGLLTKLTGRRSHAVVAGCPPWKPCRPSERGRLGNSRPPPRRAAARCRRSCPRSSSPAPAACGRSACRWAIGAWPSGHLTPGPVALKPAALWSAETAVAVAQCWSGQLSTSRFATRANSSTLRVTSVAPSARAWAAIRRSLCPIRRPIRSSAVPMSP